MTINAIGLIIWELIMHIGWFLCLHKIRHVTDTTGQCTHRVRLCDVFKNIIKLMKTNSE